MLSFLIASVQLNPQLDAVLNDPRLKGCSVGAVVLDEKGNRVYSRNSDIRVTPASCEKIFTCIYALDQLGPDTTLKTRFWKTEQGIIVDAPGDPSITYQMLKDAKQALGIKEPTPVFVKQAYRVGIPPTWEWDDLPWDYAAPVTAFSFDGASFQLWSDGKKLYFPISELGIKINHRRQTGKFGVKYNRWTKEMDFSGSVPDGNKKVEDFAQTEPDVTGAKIIGGIYRTFEDELPTREPDYTITSQPVRKLVKDCLEPSDNIYAEHLFLTTAAYKTPLDEDAYTDAAKRMRDFWISKGLNESDFRPIDGSGMSRHNLVTANALVNALRYGDQQAYSADLIEGLAAPGEGTLRSRLKTVNFVGKTGTLNAVSSLSGLLNPGKPNKRYVSIVMNGSVGSSSVLREIQDRFIRTLQEQDKTNEYNEARPNATRRSSNKNDRHSHGHRLY